MKTVTPASTAPGPSASGGMSRSTAASTNDLSLGLKNSSVLDAAGFGSRPALRGACALDGRIVVKPLNHATDAAAAVSMRLRCS
jgi:hypothetical protein